MIHDFNSSKVWSTVVIVDDMKTVQWHSWVHERTMRMIVEESFDLVEVVISNSGWN